MINDETKHPDTYPNRTHHVIVDAGLDPLKHQAFVVVEEAGSLTPGRSHFPPLPGDASNEIVAAGPFTTSDNLLFEPLTELLAYARRKQPQLLVLLGPFIDSDHPELSKGTVDQTFDEMFHLQILEKLQDYVECMGSVARVILMPSIRDAHHDFVFPQVHILVFCVKLNADFYLTRNNVICYNTDVNVACCTVDILKHLSAEEICRNPPGESKQRLANLAKHILSQQSFYPLYPPAKEVPLDFSFAEKALRFSLTPDILILPSDLAPFVKVLTIEGGDDDAELKNSLGSISYALG
ncbi:DNA polymerase alpha 2 [Striga hermonthica]|uniref:DNA polymerase alpha subunit B n=1 Tax=Striga hermonthica TaxID=68872 RepID=A0A9N7RTM3_STRHE|nr:DNA polymerase alpha 2 [Striga hermonthica]